MCLVQQRGVRGGGLPTWHAAWGPVAPTGVAITDAAHTVRGPSCLEVNSQVLKHSFFKSPEHPSRRATRLTQLAYVLRMSLFLFYFFIFSKEQN